MVVIQHCPPSTMNAYSTSPLTDLMTSTVQHGIYDGSRARFGDRKLEVTIHDRSEFHGLSHYELRKLLDGEEALAPFLVVDAQTPDTDAVWYVPTSEYCKAHKDFPPATRPPNPDEDFILWQAHMRVSDVPLQHASWSVACGDLIEMILNYYHPYDPDDLQNEIIRLGVNWTDRETQATFWGFAYVRANWSEVEWSTDPSDRGRISPRPPVVARLTSEAAREFGLSPAWSPKQTISTPGDEISLIAQFDWNSPLWPTGYPEYPLKSRGPGRLQLPQALPSLNESKMFPFPSGCSATNQLKQGSCTQLRLMQADINVKVNNISDISEQ